MPYVATTEHKAEMLAEALEIVFLRDITTKVFEDGGKWGVAVIEGAEHIRDPLKDERIVSPVILLMHFDLTDSTGNITCVEDALDAGPAAQKALAQRARRSFRIEDKLDRILAALDGMGGRGHV